MEAPNEIWIDEAGNRKFQETKYIRADIIERESEDCRENCQIIGLVRNDFEGYDNVVMELSAKLDTATEIIRELYALLMYCRNSECEESGNGCWHDMDNSVLIKAKEFLK